MTIMFFVLDSNNTSKTTNKSAQTESGNETRGATLRNNNFQTQTFKQKARGNSNESPRSGFFKKDTSDKIFQTAAFRH